MLCFSIISCFSITYAELDASEKVYFDAQNQKTIAQLSAKIDDTKTQLEKTMINEFKDSTLYIESQMQNQIKTGLKAMAIGITGIIIVSLALFKVIDMRFNRTRMITKYEEQLKKQLEQMKQYKSNLDIYKQSLVDFSQGLNKDNPEYLDKSKVNAPLPKKKFNKTIFFVVGFLIFALIILFVFKFIILKSTGV